MPRRSSAGGSLNSPQARILAALAPEYEGQPEGDWPTYSRVQLALRAGYSPLNTLNRVLRGQDNVKGLIPLGLVRVVVLDIDGIDEVNYSITEEGVRCLKDHRVSAGK